MSSNYPIVREKVSRSRVVLAPKPKTRDEIEQTLRPEQLPVDGKLTKEATTLEDIPHKVAETKQTNDNTEEYQPPKDAASQSQNNKKKESEEETEDSVIDSIVAEMVEKADGIDMQRKSK